MGNIGILLVEQTQKQNTLYNNYTWYSYYKRLMFSLVSKDIHPY